MNSQLDNLSGQGQKREISYKSYNPVTPVMEMPLTGPGKKMIEVYVRRLVETLNIQPERERESTCVFQLGRLISILIGGLAESHRRLSLFFAFVCISCTFSPIQSLIAS